MDWKHLPTAKAIEWFGNHVPPTHSYSVGEKYIEEVVEVCTDEFDFQMNIMWSMIDCLPSKLRRSCYGIALGMPPDSEDAAKLESIGILVDGKMPQPFIDALKNMARALYLEE